MKIRVTWEQVEAFIEEAEILARRHGTNAVYGLPRGGLVLAVMLSHRLNIPLLLAPAKGCLIVDDICDSGESLLHYRKNSSGEENNDYTIITMFYKENSLGITPDHWMRKKHDNWIVFPWEKED